MKKWITLFIIIWFGGGAVFLYFSNDKEKSENQPAEEQTADNNPVFVAKMAWIVGDEDRGDYKSPYWMRDKSLAEYVDEMDHAEHNEHNSPEYQLITFFAEAQIGNPKQITSYLSHGKRSKDFKSISLDELDQIDQMLKDFADEITKNQSIEELYISPPIYEADNRLIFDLLIQFKDIGQYKIPNIPLVLNEENESWGIDLTLSEFVSRVQLAQKTEENPRVD